MPVGGNIVLRLRRRKHPGLHAVRRRTSYPRMLRHVLLAVLLCAAAPVSALAQDGEAASDEAEIDRWKMLLDFSFSATRGNQDLTFVDGGVNITHLQTDAAEFALVLQARSGTDNGERVAESYRGSLDASLHPQQPWSPFAFGSLERDRFKQLDVRSNVGGGVKYTFLRDENSQASLSLGLLHSREDFRPPELPTSTDGRLSWRFKGSHTFPTGLLVQNTTFYQPVWDTGGDYVLSSITQAAVQVFSMLAITTAYEYERDSTPAPDVEPDDHFMKVGVQVQL